MTDMDRFIEAADALLDAAGKVSYLQSGGPCTGIQSEKWNAELREAFVVYRAAREAITKGTPPAFATSA